MIKRIKSVVKRKVSYAIYFYYKLLFRKPVKPFDLLWVKTTDIKYALKAYNFKGNLPKDYRLIVKHWGTLILNSTIWEFKTDAERDRRDSFKYQSIKHHFVDNVPWIETTLFTVRFKKNMREYGEIEGYTSLEELAKHYDNYYDPLFEEIKTKGLIPATKNNNVTPLYIDIDKEGNFCYTYGGNHRLAMALILGIEEIPLRIRAIHKGWQLLRDELWEIGTELFFEKYPHLKGHVGLQDCMR